jgi:hypothetical protein
MELFELHRVEVAHFKDIPLGVDVEMYNKIEDNGALRCFTARDDDNVLIGYCLFFIKQNPHYNTSLQANQDVLFIRPDRRGFGRELVTWCDEELKKEGVQVVTHHVKAKKELNFSPMLESMGYELIDLVYGKRLDKGI